MRPKCSLFGVWGSTAVRGWANFGGFFGGLLCSHFSVGNIRKGGQELPFFGQAFFVFFFIAHAAGWLYQSLVNSVLICSRFFFFSYIQAGLTPLQAANLWSFVKAEAEALGADLVSPSVNWCGEGCITQVSLCDQMTFSVTVLVERFNPFRARPICMGKNSQNADHRAQIFKVWALRGL